MQRFLKLRPNETARIALPAKFDIPFRNPFGPRFFVSWFRILVIQQRSWITKAREHEILDTGGSAAAESKSRKRGIAERHGYEKLLAISLATLEKGS